VPAIYKNSRFEIKKQKLEKTNNDKHLKNKGSGLVIKARLS